MELQCCGNICCTAESLSYTYILSYTLFCCRLSQDVEYISLCYTVRPCCLDNCYLNTMVTLYSDIKFPLQAKCSLCIFWCWLSFPVCAFPTSVPAHQAPCGLSTPARFPWPGATSLFPALPEHASLMGHDGIWLVGSLALGRRDAGNLLVSGLLSPSFTPILPGSPFASLGRHCPLDTGCLGLEFDRSYFL